MSHYLITLLLTASILVHPARSAISTGLDDAAWERYQHAANLFKSGKASPRLVERCQKLLKKTDDPVLHGRVALLLSQVLNSLGEYRRAHTVLRDLYSAKKNLPSAMRSEARLREAQLFIKENQGESAVELLNLVANNTSSIFLKQESRIALASLDAEVGNWTRVDSMVQEIMHAPLAYGEDERVKVLQARHMIASDEPEAAINLLEQTRSRTALKYLAEAYDRSGQPMMAVAVFKKIHDLHPTTPQAEEALFKAGEVFMRSQDWLAARSQYNLLLQRFPDTSYKQRAYFRLGWTYLYLDELDEAIMAFRKGAVSKGRPYFSYMEAESLRRLGSTNPSKYREAILKYNSIVALGHNGTLAPNAQFQAALTLLQTGSLEDAIISLRQFLVLYPKSEFVPAVSFLLATHMEGGLKRNYFEEILQRYSESQFFKAALAKLQKEDYDRGDYQDVINRQARIDLASDDTVHQVGHRELHLILAESAYYLRQYEQARREYSEVLVGTDDELSQKAELGEAWCLLQTGKLDSAVTVFAELRDRLTERNAVQASFGLATAHFRMKNYEDAIRTYPTTPVDTSDVDSGSLAARSLYRVGESYFRLQYYTQAIETWEKLVLNFSKYEFAPEAQFKIGDTYFLANHFEEAIAAFSKIRHNYADHPLAAESLLKTAQSKFNAGQYNEAIADFEGFVQEYSDHRSGKAALEGIQLCYYQLGETEQASEALKKLIAQSPNDVLAADARFRLAQTQLDGSQYQQAIQSFKDVLTTYPGTSYAKDAQFALAQAYLQSEDYTQANAELSRFIQYFPKSQKVPEALFQLGVGYFNEQSYLTALDYFNRIVDEFPSGEFHEPALQNIGWCYFQLGQQDQALVAFDQYLSAFPTSDDHSKVRLQVVKMQAKEGDVRQAKVALKALQASGDSAVVAEASYHLGMIHLQTEDWQAAKKAFRIAIKHGTQDTHHRLSAISQLAAIYENEQDWQRAVAAYQMLTEGSSDEALQRVAEERIQALTPMLSAVNQND